MYPGVLVDLEGPPPVPPPGPHHPEADNMSGRIKLRMKPTMIAKEATVKSPPVRPLFDFGAKVMRILLFLETVPMTRS